MSRSLEASSALPRFEAGQEGERVEEILIHHGQEGLLMHYMYYTITLTSLCLL